MVGDKGIEVEDEAPLTSCCGLLGRNFYNLCVLAVAFMLIFLAYMTTQTLVAPLIGGLGSISLFVSRRSVSCRVLWFSGLFQLQASLSLSTDTRRQLQPNTLTPHPPHPTPATHTHTHAHMHTPPPPPPPPRTVRLHLFWREWVCGTLHRTKAWRKAGDAVGCLAVHAVCHLPHIHDHSDHRLGQYPPPPLSSPLHQGGGGGGGLGYCWALTPPPPPRY
jgi:hypothetical protein